MTASAGPPRPVVLAVDDDPDILDLLSHTLETRGFEVWTAADADAALQVCRERSGAVQVLLADLSLPGDLKGNLTRVVTAEFPHVKTIFVTGIPRYIAVGSGLVRPEAPYLEKPVDPDHLAGLIRDMLRPDAAKRSPG